MSEIRRFCFLISFCVPSLVVAQEHEQRVCMALATVQPPVINGVLDDYAWEEGIWNGDFWQYSPDEGRPVRQKTEFKLLYDDDNIYVAVKAWDSSPDSIVSRLTRRDEIDGDNIIVYFDSYYDQRTAFAFGVSAAGVKSDMVLSDDGNTEDETWDPIWYVRTAIHSWGWTAEMRIPLSQLRFSSAEKQTWGLEVIRNIYRYDEDDFWQPIARNAPGIVHLAGLLRGIENIRPHKQTDITPFGVLKGEFYEGEEGNPWYDGSDLRLNAGLDAKIGITSNLIMSLSINPDFGQVEADPSEVNLTAFESYFDEKRPFFIEGKNITDFKLGLTDDYDDNLFYSRRIGRSPQISYAEQADELSYTPTFTPILGAAKITGKTKGGWSVGAMEAVTSQVKTRILNTATEEETNTTAEPLTNYSVSRVQKDFRGGRTIVGGMFTSTNRSLNEAVEDYLHKSAYTAGIDYTQYFGRMNYIFKIRTSFSQVNGTEEAIARTQRSTRHNFTRPDATYVVYDPTRTSLAGTGGNIMTGKIGGDFQAFYLSTWKSPGLELNDAGYMQAADQYLGVMVLRYNIFKPFALFNRMGIGSNLIHQMDFGGRTLLTGAAVSWTTQFKNLWSITVSGQLTSKRRDNQLLRGGPTMKMPGAIYLSGEIETDARSMLVAEISGSYNHGLEDNYSIQNISFELTYRPVKTIILSAEPEWTHSDNIMQYVTATTFAGNEPRYLFAHINFHTLSMSLRADFNITPDLSIQYWGQPFFSSGEYSGFKMITDPLAEEMQDRYHTFTETQISLDEENDIYNVDEDVNGTTDYSFYNPDFTRSEFLSNFVIRWEFLPGSTAYLVWSQSREYTTGDGVFNFNSQFYDIFSRDKPCNIFLLKISYRFGL